MGQMFVKCSLFAEKYFIGKVSNGTFESKKKI
jgi:hypothetical protein